MSWEHAVKRTDLLGEINPSRSAPASARMKKSRVSELLEKVVLSGGRGERSVVAQAAKALAAPVPQRPVIRHEEDENFKRMAFTFAVIGLSAKLARVDGEVTREEFLAFRECFPLQSSLSNKIRSLFDMACSEATPFEHYARQIARLFAGKKILFRELVQRLFKIAAADGAIQPSELAILKKVTHILGFTKAEFEKMLAQQLAPQVVDPYRVLEISSRVADDELKKHYRRLIRAHHPDHQQGDMREMAEMKLASINEAYDLILRKRGIKQAK